MEQRHLDVVRYYMQGYTKKDCLLKAGYSMSVALTDQDSVFNRPDVSAEIKKRQDRMMKRNEVTEDWIVQRLMDLAEASIGDLIEVDTDGNPSLDMTKLNPQLRYALSGFDVEKYMKGRGKDGKPVTTVKVKLTDKLRALELLMKYKGMLTERVSVDIEDNLISKLNAGRARAAKNEQPD